jgi:predicted ribosomally synthesized peptide with nif11-like leader
MSEASAQRFVRKLSSDKKLKAELKAAKGDVMKVAKAHRYTFTKADMRKVVKKRFGGSKPPRFDDPNLTCF